MKDYNNIPFKNQAIDRLTKNTTQPPTSPSMSLKDKAENRMADKIKKGYPYTTTYVDDKNRQIASLKDPQSKTYVSMSESKRPIPKTLTSGSYGNLLNDSEKNLEATTYDKYSGNFVNTQQKLKTLAPSYVEPTGPKTLQGVKTRKK